MKEFCKFLEGQTVFVKVLLAFPVLDLVWSVYRLFRAISAGDAFKIVLAALTIFPGAFFMWILDIGCLIFTGKPFCVYEFQSKYISV